MIFRLTNKLAAAKLLLIFTLFAGTALAQDKKQLTDEDAKKAEAITAEIQQLTDTLNQLNSSIEQAESAGDTEELEKDVEDLKDLAEDLVDVADDIDEDISLWSGSVDFGYVDTSGNTEETTIKSAADIKREREEWRYNIDYNSLNTKSSGSRTAEKYFLANRLAYSYIENDYVYGYASYDEDHFSGFDFQVTASVGWGHRIINEDDMEWDVEVGPGYRYSKTDDSIAASDVSEEAILRLFTSYLWDFSDSSTFKQVIHVEGGADNTISKSITSLKVDVIGALALKLSYTIKYTEEVPVGTMNADTETAVALSYSF